MSEEPESTQRLVKSYGKLIFDRKAALAQYGGRNWSTECPA